MPAKRSFAWIALVPVLVVVLASPLSAAPPVSTKMPENEPRPPEFVKKATWQETLVANREALLQWETLQDNLALAKAGAVLGPWYVLGPLSPKSKDLQTLRKAEKIDLVARYDDGNGREIGWQKCEQIQDGRVNDLTRYGGADKDSVLFECRSVGFQQPAYLREVSLDLSVDNGSAYWLPKWLGSGTLGLLPAVRPGPSILVDSPTHQLLVELNAGADGRRRLCLALRSYAQESGGGTHGVRYDRRRNIYQQVRTAFAGPAEQMQLRWETEAGLWMSQAAV